MRILCFVCADICVVIIMYYTFQPVSSYTYTELCRHNCDNSIRLKKLPRRRILIRCIKCWIPFLMCLKLARYFFKVGKGVHFQPWEPIVRVRLYRCRVIGCNTIFKTAIFITRIRVVDRRFLSACDVANVMVYWF